MTAAVPTALRILFLVPFPPDLQGSHGGARATAAIIETLSRGHDVSVLYLAPADLTPIRCPPGAKKLIAVPALAKPNAGKSIWARVGSALSMLVSREPDWVRESWSDEMAKRAAQLAAELQPDVVDFEYHVMGQYLRRIAQAAPNAALVITEYEPGIVAAAEHGRGRNSIRQRLSSFIRRCAWARFERKTLSRADAVITFTPKDRHAIRQLLGPSRVRVECIPLRLPLDPRRSTDDAPRVELDMLFVGNFAHPPNIDAATRLVRQVFPRVRQAIPSSSLYIVGPHPPRELQTAATPGIVVTGGVPDVDPYLRGASVVLVPLREGGGVRVKMLEACAAGKAIIASGKTVEGLSLRKGVEFVAAETDDEFATAAIALLGNPAARERLGQAARAWALRTQEPEAWAAEYYRFYSDLLLSRTAK